MSLLGVLLFSSCQKSHFSAELQHAEDLLWSNPANCVTFLDSLEKTDLTEYDKNVCALFREHAMMKIMRGLEDDSLLFALKDYFESKQDYRYAGEANYIIGRNYGIYQNTPLATFYLKTAEEYLIQVSPTQNRLLGSTYYSLGKSAEADRIFEIANDYYHKALPYFIDNNDSLYISCAYRDLAKSGSSPSESLVMIDSALSFSVAPRLFVYHLESEITKYKILQTHSPRVVLDYHLLCDSLHFQTYATELFDYYFSLHQLDTAYHYLTLSALDTANSYWSKEHYLFNKACYLAEVGQKDSAIEVLKDLHLEQTAEIENSSFARAYMVEQRYDAERERTEKEKVLTEKRHAHTYIILICVATLLLTITLLLLLQRERQLKQEREKQLQLQQEQLQLQQKQLELRQEQLEIKQTSLQQQLRQRLDVSTALKRHKVKRQKANEEVYDELLADVVFLKPESWSGVLTAFDEAYYGLLTNLSSTVTGLSDVDQLYIAMIILGFTTEDISLLTNVSNQSVWNRKHMLRQRLGIDGSSEVEDWLMALSEQRREEWMSLTPCTPLP